MTMDPLLSLHTEEVLPEWVDYNGHMNVAWYVLAFDHATDALLDWLGLGRAYAESENRSVFVLEAHVTYEREVTAGDTLRFRTRLIDHDARRLHVFHEMFHDGEGFLASTIELVMIHVDLGERRAVPLPDAVRDRLAALAADHGAAPRPPQVGRTLGLRQSRS